LFRDTVLLFLFFLSYKYSLVSLVFKAWKELGVYVCFFIDW
jgi:hypothetical protein